MLLRTQLKIKIIKNRLVFSSASSIINLLFLVSASTFTGGYTPAFAKNNIDVQLDSTLVDDKDSDKDGLSDAYEKQIGLEPYLADTDGDGINDGIEVGDNLKKPFNHDGDKRIDALDLDDDNDGLPTIMEIVSGIEVDTDKDGIKNYLDTDSDNDGVNDGLEAGMLGKDTNFDKIDDAFDAYQKGVEDNNGDGIADSIKIPDHNQDGIADMLDKKYQYSIDKQNNKHEVVEAPIGKKVTKQKNLLKDPKKVVSKKKLTKVKVVKQLKKEPVLKSKIASTQKKQKPKKVELNKMTDSDNDGLLDIQEINLGTNPQKRDSDGDKVSDAIEIGLDPKSPQDTDHDGIIDALDPDDDNDGVLTRNEDINKDGSPINDDTDDDGVPNYQDANDDGDSRLTIEEGSKIDSDQDGILDYLDKNDGVKNKNIQVATNKKLSEIPEVVILYEGSQEDFDNKPFQNLSVKALVEDKPSIDKLKQAENNKKPLKNERVTKALEKAIASNIANDNVRKITGKNNLADGKLAKKQQVSLRKKESGFIPWLTSLLPD